MHGIWMLVGLFSILATNVAVQSCPANLNSEAQIVLTGGRRVVPDASLPTASVDTNLTFFREFLGFDDARIQHETQSVLQFFNERFGLNFTLSEPDELGRRFFQNATLQPFSRRRPSGATATFNRWLVTGSTRARCFTVYTGGHVISFTGEQTLRGTYGGEEGIQVTSSKTLRYDYLYVSIPRRDPLVIQRRTPIPNEAQHIGLYVLFFELSHPILGQGAQQGFFQTESSTVNGTTIVRRSGSAVLTFPPNVLSFN